MSAITKERIELFIKNPLENGLTRSEQMEVARIALASLGAEPVAVNDDMAYAFHHALSDSSPGADEVEEIKAGLRAALANVTVLPVLIVPDEMDLLTCHLDGVTETYADGWNACRVAMLQAGNFRENKNSSTNNFREIPETSTSSPGTPAGWISCSDAVPAEYCDVILRDDLGNVFPGSWDKVFCPTRGGNKMAFVDQDGVEVEDSTHWMPLPEPPQEEKSGNADCSDTSGKTDNPQASGKQVNELTMLVKQLVSQLKKAKPDCKLPDKAMDYLKRNGLISVEDILR